MLPNREEYLELLKRIAWWQYETHPDMEDVVTHLSGQSWQAEIQPENPFFVFEEEAKELLNWFIKYRVLEFQPMLLPRVTY